jgi:hypothetical protein
MSNTKAHYFYLWRHRYIDDITEQIVARTCLGITSNPNNRIHGYEGHVGHTVKFVGLWTGPERLIREIESKIKCDFHDYLFVGSDMFRYEWIDERIEYKAIHDWVMWEVENSYIGITEVTYPLAISTK